MNLIHTIINGKTEKVNIKTDMLEIYITDLMYSKITQKIAYYNDILEKVYKLADSEEIATFKKIAHHLIPGCNNFVTFFELEVILTLLSY